MMKKFKINTNSFQFKIACYYLAASLAFIFAFSGIIYLVVAHIIVQETVSKTEMTIQTSSDRVGEILRYQKNLLQLYSADARLQSFVSGQQQLEEEVRQQLTTIANSDANILGVFISLEDGTSLTSAETAFSQDVSTVVLDTLCVTNDRVGSYRHSDQWMLTLAMPIVDADGTQIGVLGADLDYCIFSHTFDKLNLGEQDFIFIENSQGELVFRSDKISPGNKNADAVLSHQLENGYDAKNNTLVYRVLIPNTDWSMFGVVSPEGLSILKRQLFDMMILTTVLLALALMTITVVVSRNLTDPISRLAAGMEDIQQLAELSIRKDEISETAILTKSYNRMIQKIKELMQQLEQKQEQLRRAEFDALTSQINPHFLYNTLDTIVWLAEFKDTEKIIKLTKSLAAFFRLSLNGGRSVVSLADEIEHIKQYLIIQKERYGDKFDYDFDIQPNTLECMMPKILLQPIVENAIYHGIKPMDTNGTIHIQAQRDHDFLVVTISDNGVGLQQDKGAYGIKKSGEGLGLNNVEQRIKLFYGPRSTLQMQSSHQGTHVILRLDQCAHPDQLSQLGQSS